MRLLLALFSLFTVHSASAGHISAAEVQYEHLFDSTYAITIHVWSNAATPSSNLLQLFIGSFDTLVVELSTSTIISAGQGCFGQGVRHNRYDTTYTFPGAGSYLLRTRLFSRNAGLLNIPNSVQEPLCVKAELIIGNNNSANSSVAFLQPALNFTHIWGVVQHDPLAFEPDGDSLHFELITPLGDGCDPIDGYNFPHEVGSSSGYSWVDPVSGVFTWDSPFFVGEYVIGIKVSEWRNGQFVGSTIRDMTLCITSDIVNSISDIGSGSDISLLHLEQGLFEIADASSRNLTWQVFDQTGRRIDQGNLSAATLVDIRSATSGIYSLVVAESNGEQHKVFRVLR